MESLYTKYRPQTFADVVGQGHVVKTLERAVLEGRTSHAYLFCGPRGTGKTTMARLLAKALMCEQGAGHLPDGTCEQCRMIAAGEHPDVYELDAASRTGVDNVREEIISRVSFAPVRAPYKMYIIDEVHMLTTAAFNALLKTLEEPPAHVVFVLCTTDPQKIPETILSRVQRFDFHAIGNADILGRLAYICQREGFSYDEEALELVVRHSRGGMRDAISELEQLSVSGGGSITVDIARDVLGEVPASTLERMSLAMANRDVATLFAQVESLVEVGRDLLQLTRALAARLRDVYVVAAIGADSPSVLMNEDDLPSISREAKAFGSVDRVGRALSLLSDASTEMRVAPNQRLVLEVALTKIARPQSELTLEALADRVSTLERQLVALSARGAQPQSKEKAPSVQQQSPAQGPAPERDKSARMPAQQAAGQSKPLHAEPKQSASTVAAERHATQEAVSSRQGVPAPSGAQPSRVAPATSAPPDAPRPAGPSAQGRVPAPSAQPAARGPWQRQAPGDTSPSAPASSDANSQSPGSAVTDAGELQRRWKQVVDGLLAAHPQHGSLLMSSSILSDDGGELTVSLPSGSLFALKMLERADVRANVDPMVAQVFGTRKARFVIGEPAPRPAGGQGRGAQAPTSAQGTPAPASRPVPQAPTQTPTRTTAPSVAPVPKAAPAPAPQPAPAPAPGATRVPTQVVAQRQQQSPSSYPAPWDSAAYDDEAVPYDDLAAAPYEEDYLFDGPAAPHGVAPEPVGMVAPVAPIQPPQPVPAPIKPVQVRPEVPSAAPSATAAPSPGSDAMPEPAPVQKPAPIQEADAVPAPEAAPVQAQPKRKSRRAGGIPTDIVAMMTEIFGEGITYTSEPAEDEAEETLEEEVTSYDEGEAPESEFLEEAEDDADYDGDE